MRNDLVSTSQPSIVLSSSEVPSPRSFLSLMASARGSGSEDVAGLNIV